MSTRKNKRVATTTKQNLPEKKRKSNTEKDQKNLPSIIVVVLDIEGTTTPIAFVTETLFPYVRKCLSDHLNKHWEAEELQQDIEELRKLAAEDKKTCEDIVLIPTKGSKKDIQDAIIKNVNAQMDKDRKTPALKQLQGHMWKSGYEGKELKGEVYDDVLDAFEEWKKLQVPVYIYSSGSVQAQKLLFGYSNKGDLLPYLKGHFDTKVGAKVESSSYTKIFEEVATELNLKEQITLQKILFVTDNIDEANAAAKAGMHVALAVRPGNKPLTKHEFVEVKSFAELKDHFFVSNTNNK